MSKEEYDEHIRMQNLMFPDWKKYWKYTPQGEYVPIIKEKQNKKKPD